jgi:hypothetical protein
MKLFCKWNQASLPDCELAALASMKVIGRNSQILSENDKNTSYSVEK